MSSLWYPSVKQSPFTGFPGFGGGATSASFRSSSLGDFATYKMFAPKGSIATSNMSGAGRSGVVVYPCKDSITENSDFDSETGTSLTAGTFFDSPTPTIAAAFGIASNVSTTVQVNVRDDSQNAVSPNYSYSSRRQDSISGWDDFPKVYGEWTPGANAGGVGVVFTGFWKTDTDSLGKWKTSASGVYAQPSRTLPSSGQSKKTAYAAGWSNFSDAVTAPDNANSGGYFGADWNPFNKTGGLGGPNTHLGEFVFDSGLGSALGFVIQGWNDSTWITNGKGADYQGHVFIIDVFETGTR
tara:strand:+ start:119 stop:1009 length:891 start_codon:yes stop_codon:yes gene_type:complete